MKISDIYINPKNPRFIKKERFEKLKKNVREFSKMMKLRPIIIDDNRMILDGNMRYRVLKELGYKEIPDEWVIKASELSKDEKRRFIITTNLPYGDWDIDLIATVTVSLRNEGTRPINSIAVSDTLPSEFEPAENSSLLWELDLGAGEYRSFTYQLKPMQPSEEGYVIPAAVAKWGGDGRTYTAHSNSPAIAVYGPKIELSKRVAPETIEEGGIVDVEILIKNTGNVLASIDVTDSLPVDAVLIDGASGGRAVLAAGESHTFGYRMRVNTTGYAELPPAVAHFADTHDYDGTVVSENISIMVNPVAHSARTIDTPDQMIPTAATANTTTRTAKESGAGSVCALVGFFAAVFVIMQVKRT